MKTIYWLAACLMLVTAAHAQRLHFETDSLRQVQARAQQQHQLVLVVVAPPVPPASVKLSPEARKVRSESGLTAPEVVRALGPAVLVKQVAFGSAEAGRLGREFGIASYPTYLYFAPDGALLYRRFGNASSAQPYLKDIAAARQELTNPHNMSYYEAEYARGNRDATLLHDYLAKRQQLGQAVPPALLDTYAEQLPAGAFDQGATVQFILEQGPVINSRAYQLTHLNQKLIDSLYRVLPLPQRMAINSRMIARTLAEAVARHDANLARQGANFASSSWKPDYLRAGRAYETNMLDFYRLTKDTANYLPQVTAFYQRYYMTIPADSVRKALAAQAARQRLAASHFQPGTVMVATTVRASAGPTPAFVSELNIGAWNVYLTGTRNRRYLTQAAEWSKRTVYLAPTATYYDTLAHLLYRLRYFAEAEAMQQQAVAQAAPEGMSAD
ncbi:MAG: hypothetical protein ACRYFK_13475 [Janthinobacterium lividum]